MAECWTTLHSVSCYWLIWLFSITECQGTNINMIKHPNWQLDLHYIYQCSTVGSYTKLTSCCLARTVGSETVSSPEWCYRRVINLLLTVFWSDKVRSVVGSCRLTPQTTQSWTSPQGPIKERKQRNAERQTQYKLTEPCGLDWTNTCLAWLPLIQQQQH